MSQPAGDKPKEVLDLSRDPLKHYVRIHGWVDAARQRLVELQQQGAEREYGLRYFTLCGKDGIDIFLFERERLIRNDDRGFPSVYYCELYYPHFAELKPILGRTAGARDKFEDLVNRPWFRKRVRNEPFDVVNLDFSGSCFPKEDPPFSRTLKSLYTLLEYQIGQDFDLFVTFKASRSYENEAAVQELLENMEKNFHQSAHVRDKFQERFSGISLNQFLRNYYGQFLLITFPKILFGFAMNHGFVGNCTKKFVYQRATNHNRRYYQIVKFIFSFRTVVTGRSFSDVSRRHQIPSCYYEESVMEDLDKPILDVDRELGQNSNLLGELKRDCIEIIENRKPFGQ